MKKIFIPLLLIANICFGQVDLNLGLKAYYPFSGNANDVSGNNNNPVFNNATLTADRLGNPNSAYHFNGADNYMKIPNSPSINMTNQMSIAVWVKPMGFYNGSCHNNMIVAKGDADYLTGNYSLRFTPDPLNGCVTNPPFNQSVFYGLNALAPNPFVELNRWYSVVWTTDGVTGKIYVDCILRASGPANSLTFTNTFDMFFGRMNHPSFPYWLNGDLDEVRIYDRALNVDEVNVLGGCAVSEINTYTPVLGLNICDNKLTVADASTFNTGDTVMMMQMKGAVIDSTNTSAFGTITDYKNSGNYEFNYVKSKVGNIIELKNKLTRQYDIPLGKVQLIRVPYYNSLNVNATLTCLPWDGSKGGVLVLNVKDTLNLTADIDVSGKGFNGGIDPVSVPTVFNCNENQYYYPLNPDLASGKGEGIANISSAKSFGKGALANGGGGGNSHNSGGAGGGNIGAGGFGGYQLESWPCNITVPFDNRGISGNSLTYSNASNKIFLGGGGGAGHTNNAEGFEAKGGNGGGIIIISAGNLTANSKKIIANGNDASACGLTTSGCHEGMGGGGAAGAVLLKITNYMGNTNIETKGGKGADMTAAGYNKVGPGGGGSGGPVWLSNASLPANISVLNTGGINGVCTAYTNSPWGATPGASGQNLFNLVLPLSLTAFKKNIDSVRIKDSLVDCYSFNFKGLAYFNTYPVNTWQWDFGDGATANTQNTTHTYSVTGIFIVKLIVTDINGCKDSIIKNITVATSLTPTITITGSNNICKGNPVTFTAGTLYGGATPTFQWQKNGNPVGNNSSTYTDVNLNNRDVIKCVLTSSLSCAVPTTATSNPITMTVNNAPANIRYPTIATLFNQPLQLQARNIGVSYEWKPNVGLNNNFIINPIFIYGQAQEYKIYINISSGCQVVDTLLVKISGKKGLYVPKAFSPNDDGTNDRLYPILVGIKQLLYFRIYNRWGNLIFETNSGNPAFGWDGRLKGHMQPVETYTWTAEAIDIDNIVIKKNGSTLLIR